MSGEPSAGGFAPARILWEQDSAGRQIPRSLDFDDCYYSAEDGLAETRHVFLKGNRLAERFSRLQADDRFVIAETGFGVGLNFLAAAKLWQQSGSRGELHYISSELFGVTKADLRQAHASFPELDGISARLIEQYPDLIPGVHRMHFADLKITLDLWFGEASESLSKLVAPLGVDAWFLDGFSPRQNLEMWAQPVFEQIKRLSRAGSTAATFSAARVVKQGLLSAGFMISKTGGFGSKRHMTQARHAPNFKHIFEGAAANLLRGSALNHHRWANLTQSSTHSQIQAHGQARLKPHESMSSVAVIGAGIAGLCAAYKLSSAGLKVILFEGNHPLCGSSGNPRAMLAPKITPFAYAADHLHTQSFLFATRFYSDLARSSGLPALFQACGVADQPKQRTAEQWPALIQGYPASFVQMHPIAAPKQSQADLTSSQQPSLWLPSAGIIDPRLVAQSILAHPLIELKSAQVNSVSSDGQIISDGVLHQFDQVVICAGSGTPDLIQLGSAARTTKGQISWIRLSTGAGLGHTDLLKPLAQKFGGYAIIDELAADQASASPLASDHRAGNPILLFGATNERNYAAQEISLVTQTAHLANLDKLRTGSASLYEALGGETQPSPEMRLLDRLEGRASIRFQLRDHMPLCGPITDRLSVISALGSKGFCYAPYAAELLKNLLLQEPNLASLKTLERLNPQRYVLQDK